MTSESDDSKYLPELMAEKDSIDASFVHAVRLITKGELETGFRIDVFDILHIDYYYY